MAAASSSVSVTLAPLPILIPPEVTLPDITTMRLLPIELICSWIRSVAPEPTDTMAITAATPIMMPSIVRPERRRFAANAARAMRALSKMFFMAGPSF